MIIYSLVRIVYIVFESRLYKKVEFKMNALLPYHIGDLIQKGRGIGSVFSSLFRILLPTGKAVIKSAPSIIKSTAKSPIGKKLKRSAKRLL